MTDEIRIALFGTGRIGRVHAMSVAVLGGALLALVCDPLVEAAQRTAAEFGGRATPDPEEVLSSGEVDAVIIASPTSTHIDLIEAAIDAGLPVLCEKPIDLDIARVDAVREKAASSPVTVALGFQRRFDRHFLELKRRVADGDIGMLEQLAITSRDPEEPSAAYLAESGGIFRDMTIHDLDVARFFVPNIVEVSARGTNAFSENARRLSDFDSAAVTLRGADEELVTILNSRHAAYGYDQRVEAFGKTGLLQVSNQNDTLVRQWSADSVNALPPYQRSFLERYAEAYRLEVSEFLKAVRGQPSRISGFEDGRAALILADAAERSARTGTTIAVDLAQ